MLATDPWTARMLVADRFADRRVFLVGESAHVNPPWGGHGFNTSVGDAVNIAWKIAAVEHGWAAPDLLASYEPERRGVVEQTVASAAANMRDLAGDLPADADAIQRAKRAEFHSLGLVLGYSYAGLAVIQPGAAPAPAADLTCYTPAAEPGARLPHAWLPDGSSLYDQLGPGFTLVGPSATGPAAVATWPPAPPRAASRWRWPSRRRTIRGATEFLLVRPDQHIAWRAADRRHRPGRGHRDERRPLSASMHENGEALMASPEQRASRPDRRQDRPDQRPRVRRPSAAAHDSTVVIDGGRDRHRPGRARRSSTAPAACCCPA